MKKIISSIKSAIFGEGDASYKEIPEEEYVELDTTSEDAKSKIIIRPFTLEEFSGIKPILESIRTGNTVALVNIKPLKDKDIIELKRAINKLKKTCEAINGDIAGFGDDWIVAAPSFAQIHRSKAHKEEAEEDKESAEE
ncbi:cell division protein SepF [Candidatus Woesearchaeota archaeon]|nr:cell division protein SepF [Candidatus Woesearchaeota archaeon]